MAGTGDFALGIDGDRFIKSFNIIDRSAKATLHLTQLKVNLGKGTLRETFSLYPLTYQSISKAEILGADSYNFLLSATYTDFGYIEEDSFELAYLTERFAKSIDYVVTQSKRTNLKGYPLYEGVLTKKDAATIHTRLLINGPHYFLLGVMGKDSSNIDSYVTSLKLNFESVEHPIVFTDTAFYYSTKTSSKAVAFNSKKSRQKPDINKNGIGESYKYATQTILFRDPTGNDKIEVFYKQFNNYTYYENVDAFWDERMNNITRNASLVIHSQKKSEIDSVFILELELRDTSSARSIYCNYYLKNSSYYCVSYNSDTITRMTPFVTSFYENFRITKSYSNTSLFVQKKNIFFTDIHSNDSMRVNNAYKAFIFMEFDKNDIIRLDSLINSGIPNPQFLKKNNIKSQSIKAIGYIYDPSAINYLKEAYANNSDSIQVQAELLNALATNKSASSYKCLQELLTSDVPYLSSYDVKSLFSSFYDSLELSVGLFPKILHLTRYSNYRDNIYKLLSVLIDKGLIKKGAIVSNKTDIMNDANEEIKKALSYKKKTYDSYTNTNVSYQYGKKSNYPFYDEIETYIILLSKIKKETNAKLFFLV